MKSTKPYLIRAIHEWCSDQGFTPYLAVSVDVSTRVPREFVKDGEIVLNIGLEATQKLLLGNEDITFQARFGGRSFPVVVPIERVAAIYASENGEGMAFEVSAKLSSEAVVESTALLEEVSQDDADEIPAQKVERASGPPILTRVK
ncbi:MAG: ClpXP protease specificity-enhancing factor [Sulfuritalea sp.]|nr:ClpXP protease specificity-enhancing factor [Sulfuritalea sp.]